MCACGRIVIYNIQVTLNEFHNILVLEKLPSNSQLIGTLSHTWSQSKISEELKVQIEMTFFMLPYPENMESFNELFPIYLNYADHIYSLTESWS